MTERWHRIDGLAFAAAAGRWMASAAASRGLEPMGLDVELQQLLGLSANQMDMASRSALELSSAGLIRIARILSVDPRVLTGAPRCGLREIA